MPDCLTLPILRHQPRHAGEFAAVVGNENQFARDRLAGDQDVIGTDRRALSAQMRANLAGRPRILLLEWQQGETQRIDQYRILRHARTEERTVIKLVYNDGGYADIVGAFPALNASVDQR